VHPLQRQACNARWERRGQAAHSAQADVEPTLNVPQVGESSDTFTWPYVPTTLFLYCYEMPPIQARLSQGALCRTCSCAGVPKGHWKDGARWK